MTTYSHLVRRAINGLLCLALVALTLIGFSSVSAQGPGGKPSVDISALLAKASANGSISVIVGLNMPYQADASLPSTAAVLQQSAIRSRQAVLLSGLGGGLRRIMAQYKTIPFIAVEVTPAGLQTLAANPLVANIVEDMRAYPALADSVPLMGGDVAWAQGYDGTGQVVAIVDEGVDKNHPFLAGKVIDESCFIDSECPVSTGDGVALPKTVGEIHGTHVAGIAAGRGTTFSGMARGADIMAVRVLSETGGTFAGVTAGLEHVYSMRNTYKIASVNMSIQSNTFSAGDCSASNPALATAINNLHDAGIPVVVSSGNSSKTDGISLPACIANAIAVGSTTKADAVSDFSNSAANLDLLATGSVINSSVPGTGYDELSGTSMAAPHVAGAIAIMRQHDSSLVPADILYALQQTGTPILDARNSITRNRINTVPAMTLWANNESLYAYNLPNFGGVAEQNISDTTKNVSDPQPSCVPSGEFTDTAWYTFSLPTTREVEISTVGSAYDTVLSIYPSSAITAPNQVACSDDALGLGSASRIVFQARANTQYHVMVSARGTVDISTPTNLKLAFNKTLPANDNFASASQIAPFRQWRDIDGATSEANDPLDVCGQNYRNSVWYRYTPSVTRTMQVTTHGSYIQDIAVPTPFDTVLGVYTGTHGSLAAVACNDDADSLITSRTSVAVTAGTTYYILIGVKGTTEVNRSSFAHLTITHSADTTGVRRSSNSVFYLRNGFTGPQNFLIAFGAPGDVPLIGDWDGDGIDTIGVWRPSNATFYLRNSNSVGSANSVFPFGASTDIPVVGDWAGNGVMGIGVWRPTNVTFYLRNTPSGGAANYSIRLGISTDKPIVGDWNGDGIDTVGLFRSGMWYFSNTRWCTNCTAAVNASGVFGLSTDVPIVGDWNTDGYDTPGLFRNGTWYMRTGLTTGSHTLATFGIAGDVPLAGKYAFKVAPDEPAAPSFVPKQ